MINLPKPSSISMKNSADKSNYFINYLTKLVYSLEKILSGIKTNSSGGSNKVVEDISLSGDKLIIKYTDGGIKEISLNNSQE